MSQEPKLPMDLTISNANISNTDRAIIEKLSAATGIRNWSMGPKGLSSQELQTTTALKVTDEMSRLGIAADFNSDNSVCCVISLSIAEAKRLVNDRSNLHKLSVALNTHGASHSAND